MIARTGLRAAAALGLALIVSACSTGPRTVTDSTCAEKINRLAGEANRGLKFTPGDGLKPDEVDSRIRGKKSEIRACVSGLTDLNDGLAHTVRLGVLIQKDGTVSNSCVESSQFANEKVDECIESVVKAVRFPAPRGGFVVPFHYPFLFKKEPP